MPFAISFAVCRCGTFTFGVSIWCQFPVNLWHVAVAGLDYLSSPTGPINEAQQLAASAFGADQTWFLVNGTSGGLHAAIMAACGTSTAHEVPTLVVARNCHLSAVSAMVFAGLPFLPFSST